MLGKSLSDSATVEMAQELGAYPEAQVVEAIRQWRRTSNRFPTIADLIQAIQSNDGRPGPEEAWAMIPRDEYGSVVWTDEMAEAFNASRRLSNPIEARLAFKEVYSSIVGQARASGRHPRWRVSFGLDESGRAAALSEAVEKGRLSVEHATRLLPELPEASPTIARLVAQSVKHLTGPDSGDEETGASHG